MNRLRARLVLALVLAGLLPTAHAVLLPVAGDTSSTIAGKITSVTGKATTLTVTAKEQAFVIFDLSTLPASLTASNITSARLNLYVSSLTTAANLTVHQVTNEWSEVTATVAAPGFSSNVAGTIAAADVVAKSFIEVDVTSAVSNWFNGESNFGLAIATATGNVRLGSKEGLGTGFPALLEIVAAGNSAVSPASLAGTVTNNETGVTLSGTFSGNGAGLTGLNASNLTGTLPGISGANLTALPAGVVTNNETGVTLGGTFSGSGSNLTGVALLNGSNFFTQHQTFSNGAAIGYQGASATPVYGQEALYINSSNSIGSVIGMNGSTTGGHYFEIVAAGTGAAQPAGAFGIYDYSVGAYRLSINSNGNTGIGTTTPAAKLEVNGNAQIDGIISGDGSGLTNVTAAAVSGTLSNVSLGGSYSNAITISNSGDVFYGSGAGLTNVTAATVGGLSATNIWLLNGNAGTTPGPQFLGTTDSNALELHVNGARALLLDANTNVIGGSDQNATASSYSFIGGGVNNDILSASAYSSIAGGESNIIGDVYATVGGGFGNNCSGNYAAIGGGSGNTIETEGAVISGGENNSAAGLDAAIPGGSSNTASGQYSLAAGNEAQATNQGAFVWADSQSAAFGSAGNDSVNIRAQGGVFIYDNLGATAGVTLASNATAWTSLSDRNAKKNFRTVDTVGILNKLAAIPIQQWNYKWEKDSDVPNIGPMAQDFKGAFYPGRNDKGITTLEFDGVELAAIQGLNQKVESNDQKLESELKARDAKIAALEKEIAEMNTRFKGLEKAVALIVGKASPALAINAPAKDGE